MAIKPVTLTNDQIGRMLYAIRAFDKGYTEVHGETVISRPYRVGEKMRYYLKCSLQRLEALHKAYTDARHTLIDELSGGEGRIEETITGDNGQKIPNPASISFMRRHAELLEVINVVELHEIDYAVLTTGEDGKQKYDHSIEVMTGLDPILIGTTQD